MMFKPAELLTAETMFGPEENAEAEKEAAADMQTYTERQKEADRNRDNCT